MIKLAGSNLMIQYYFNSNSKNHFRCVKTSHFMPCALIIKFMRETKCLLLTYGESKIELHFWPLCIWWFRLFAADIHRYTAFLSGFIRMKNVLERVRSFMRIYAFNIHKITTGFKPIHSFLRHCDVFIRE